MCSERLNEDPSILIPRDGTSADIPNECLNYGVQDDGLQLCGLCKTLTASDLLNSLPDGVSPPDNLPDPDTPICNYINF